METSEPSSSSDPLAAAADGEYPRWVVFVDTERPLQENPCPISTDSKTVAHARTSTGHPVRASFRLAAPPAVSHLDLDLDDRMLDIRHNVVAAHGDTVLIRISMMNIQRYRGDRRTIDYFVYRAGDGTGGRLPSLSLLPPCYIGVESADFWWTMRKGTAILRCGDGEFVVVTNLKMNIQETGGVKRAEAEVHQLRSSELQWKTERLPVQGEVSFALEWVTDKVIAVADRFFYWVDLHRGIVFSDVCEESPRLRFVPLPVDPLSRERTDEGLPSRCLSTTDGGAAVKFVLLCPRCCCGGPGVTKCALSRHAFTVTTWILRSTQAGGMGWEKDGVVNSGELWDLDAYRPLPRLPVDLPMASIDDPDVVYFFVSEHWHIRRSDKNKTTWVVMIDTRTKSMVGPATIVSTERHYFADEFLPSQVSSYFNTSPGSRHQAPPASERRRRDDLVVPRALETCSVIEVPPAIDGCVGSPDQAIDGCVGSPDQAILAALQEIPGLTSDEMLRAYGALACDDRRRYQTLLALPMDMRKDYCCMLVDAMGTNKKTQ